MKLLGPALLLVVGLALGWIALSAPEQDYVPLAEEEAQPPPVEVPSALTGAVPAGHALRTLAVEGMCCTGCTAKLYDALRRIDGVVAAAVDFQAGTASAVVPVELEVARLEAALTFDKYSVRAGAASAAEGHPVEGGGDPE